MVSSSSSSSLRIHRRRREQQQRKRQRQASFPVAFLVTTTLLLCYHSAAALKHTFHRDNGRSLIGPVGVPFGFLDTGYFELEVTRFELVRESSGSPVVDTTEAGFLLQKFSNDAQFHHHLQELQENRSACAFEYFRSSNDQDPLNAQVDDAYAGVGRLKTAEHGIFLPVYGPHVSNAYNKKVEYNFRKGEAGLYFLLYQVCPYDRSIQSSFDLDFHFLNHDSYGNPSYLTAGEMKLPTLFLFFSVSYLILLILWAGNNRAIQRGLPGYFDAASSSSSVSSKPTLYPIHRLMTVLLLIKFLATFFESLRYHFLKVTGHAELWSVVYYVLTFVKGSFLFVVILLLGTGWSFVKPFLNDREKYVIAIILVLQVINNIALTVLSQITEGERRYDRWMAILHLVDIVCCCAVLVPIVWSVNTLEKTVGDEEEEEVQDHEEGVPLAADDGKEVRGENKGQILRKLRLFRSFYLLVVAYIYATRIIVYLFASVLDYQHLWVTYFVVELVTLTFYVTVGCLFRPMTDNPYLNIQRSQWNRNNNNIEMVDHRGD